MPVGRPELVNNETYHVIIRGVGDALIFKDINDYYRGIFSIYEFNNTKLITIRERRKERKKEKASRGATPVIREPLVEILAFCFMPNHIHLLLEQIKDKGISEFVRKVGTGYAGYFKKKYGWKGHLLQRFKAIHTADEEQLKTVFTYIHTNPISLIEPNWKEKGIGNSEEVIGFLENYKWSSYNDYIGKPNFPSITERKSLLEIMGDKQGCKDFVDNWVKYKEEARKFPETIFE